MATKVELTASITKWKKVIANPKTKDSVKKILKKSIDKAEKQIADLEGAMEQTKKAALPSAVKSTGQKTAAQLIKEAKERRQTQGLSTKNDDVEKDAGRKALPKGYRISKYGNKYWEGRDNRIDVKQPPKTYPKLEDGGYMAKGGDTSNATKVKVGSEIITLIKDRKEKTGYPVYVVFKGYAPVTVDLFETKELALKKAKSVSELNGYEIDNNKMQDGGMMAKGGSTMANKEINDLKNKFKSPDNEIEINGNRLKIQKKDNPLNFLTISKMASGDYNIDVTSGSIQSPSKETNATWSNLHNKYHNYDEVVKIIKRYGISINDSDERSKMDDGGTLFTGGYMVDVYGIKDGKRVKINSRPINLKYADKWVKEQGLEKYYKEITLTFLGKMAEGGIMAKGGEVIKEYEVEFTWDTSDDESRSVYIKANSENEARRKASDRYKAYKEFKIIKVVDTASPYWHD